MTKGNKIKLRAELAGKAMAAMISSDLIMTNFDERIKEGRKERRDEAFARNAVMFADALMKELGLD